MQVIYKDNIIDVRKGTKICDLLTDEILKTNAIACKFNNEVKRLDYEINIDGKIELIDITDKDGIRIYRRGLIYIIGKAFDELYKGSEITVNFQLSNSLLCEVENMEVTDEMIEKVNARVKEIIEQNLDIETIVMNREQAEKFFEKEKTLKGKLQLDVKEREKIIMYYCGDYYNYFYGVLPIKTGYINVYEILKYHGGFLVRYPNRKEPNVLQEFEENEKLLSTLQEYDDLHKVLNIHTTYRLNKMVRDDKIKKYILLDEALHEKKIAGIADSIVERGGVKVVLIAGPSSSGKTTFAQRLGLQLRLNGLKPVTISVDNYFVEREQNPKDEFGNYDFETIKAIDIDLFNDHLIKLLNGEEVKVPTFNFSKGSKEYKGNTMKLAKDEILVIEGIHCLNDELTALIPKEQKYKIYISALTVLNIDYFNRISTTDTRLIRRIVRDNQFRGYSALHTLQMWDSVNKGEVQNIFPYQEEADSMFNSSLIYELGVLKDYAVPLLKEIDNTHKEYSEAKRLYRMLSYFESIPEKYVPMHSLLREFIGGSIFED
jgi:uridine kinase